MTRSQQRSRRGVAAVEFAMTFPVVALVLLTTLEFGWYFTQLQMVNSACYDAVRAASDAPFQVDAVIESEDAVEVLLADLGFDCASLGCDIEAEAISVSGVQLVELEISVPYEQLTGIIPRGGRLLGFQSPNTLRARALMPVVGPTAL
jgi:hypothetical protein